LSHPFGRQRAVEIALANAFDIPLGLAMADDDNLRAAHEIPKSHGQGKKVNYLSESFC